MNSYEDVTDEAVVGRSVAQELRPDGSCDDAQRVAGVPAVSVVTTVYNDSRYIAACIQSVLNDKSYDDYEMIVVDDGSTDETREIIRTFRHSRLRVFHCPRRGRGKSLNFAFSAAKGRYLAILDSDDLLAPGRLAQHVEYLDQHPNVSFVGNASQPRIDSEARVTAREEKSAGDGDHVVSFLRRTISPCAHSSVTYRASIVRSVNGFTEWLPCLLDIDLYVRMASQGPPALLQGAGAFSRIHDSQYFRRRLPYRHMKRLFAQAVVAYRAASLPGGRYSHMLVTILRRILILVLEITRTKNVVRDFMCRFRRQQDQESADQGNACG